jgi:hypothetical protein
MALAAVLLLAAGGCLVDDAEFDQALERKDALRTELFKLRQSNDQLNQEISRLYADREVLSSHVAMTAAVALHNLMMPRVRPSPPPPAPAPARRPAQTARPPARPAQTQPALTVPPPLDTGLRQRPPGAVDWGQ